MTIMQTFKNTKELYEWTAKYLLFLVKGNFALGFGDQNK